MKLLEENIRELKNIYNYRIQEVFPEDKKSKRYKMKDWYYYYKQK